MSNSTILSVNNNNSNFYILYIYNRLATISGLGYSALFNKDVCMRIYMLHVFVCR